MQQTGTDVKTIGIVGGGQLGRMLTEAASPLGFKVIVIDPGANCPAAQVGAEQIVAGFRDADAIHELAQRADVITIESEHVNTQALAEIAAAGKPVQPLPATVAMIQDKFLQKEFLHKNGIPVADYCEITDKASAETALKEYGGSMIIKTRFDAFDGRGNFVARSTGDIDKAFETFGDQPLYAEEMLPFEKELAVMVARSTSGETAVYPVVETIQQRNICLEVLAPADIPAAQREAAEKLALQVVDVIDGAGVYGIEMFLIDGGHVYVNEIAPRVHNSGHYTIEGNVTSQFEQHIRAITGLPLGSTELVAPAVVMVNILGKDNRPTEVTGVDTALEQPETAVHLYGKSPTKVDRKMGHVTATGNTLTEARQRAEDAERAITL